MISAEQAQQQAERVARECQVLCRYDHGDMAASMIAQTILQRIPLTKLILAEAERDELKAKVDKFARLIDLSEKANNERDDLKHKLTAVIEQSQKVNKEFYSMRQQNTALLNVARAAKQLLDGPQVKMSLFDALNESLHKLPESGVVI